MTRNLAVSEVVRRYNKCHAPVHTIAFIDTASRPRMKQLARLTGGQHRFVPGFATARSSAPARRPAPAPPQQQPPPKPKPTVPPQRTLLAMAYSLESVGKHTAAVRRYQQVIQQYPGTPEAAFAMRRIYVLNPP
jgi:hypothetical protein